MDDRFRLFLRIFGVYPVPTFVRLSDLSCGRNLILRSSRRNIHSLLRCSNHHEMAPGQRSIYQSLTSTSQYLPLSEKDESLDIPTSERTSSPQFITIPGLMIGCTILFFWTLALISATWSSFKHGKNHLEHPLQMYCACSILSLAKSTSNWRIISSFTTSDPIRAHCLQPRRLQ